MNKNTDTIFYNKINGTILLQETQKNMRNFYEENPFKYKGVLYLVYYKLLYHPQAECIDIDKKGRLAFSKHLVHEGDINIAKKKHIITACMNGNELIIWHKPTRKQRQVIKIMYDLKIINEKALLCLYERK